MATIEELNFKLVIDDKSFDKRIDAITKKAKEMNKTVTELMNISARNSNLTAQETQQIERAERVTRAQVRTRELETREVARTAALQERLTRNIEGGNTALSRQSRLWREISGMAATYFSVAGAEKLVRNLVEISAEFEFQKTTLRAILQDVQSADYLYDQLKGLAVKSPFNFKELVTYAKQLSAYQIPVNELFETTKQLADVSSGLGVGMDRLVLAYGQVRSAAFLRGQEVRQFTEAGIPILDMLAKQFGEIEGRLVTAGEVFDKISKRQVPFEMVAKVFKDMTSEGGKFYNMQEIQADTLKGKLSNLADAYQIMFSEIGEATEGTMKGVVDWARSLAENYEEVGKTIAVATVSFGGYLTALRMVESQSIKTGLANTSLSKVIKSIKNNPYVALAAGLTAATMAIYKLITAQNAFDKAQSEYTKKYNSLLSTEISSLDRLYAKLKTAKAGTQEYLSAKTELTTKYGTFIQELTDEGVAVDNLAQLYDGLKTKIEASAQARIKFMAEKQIDEAYGAALDDLYGGSEKSLKKLSKAIGANAGEEQILWQLITGGVTKERFMEGIHEYGELVRKLRDKNNRISLGAGDSGPMQAERYLDILISKATNATEEFNSAKTAMEDFFKNARNTPGGEGGVNGGGLDKEDDVDNLIKSIEQQISAIKRLKSAYDDLAQYLTDDQIATMYGDLFTTGFNFDEQIQDLIAKLNKLGTEGQDAAQKIVLGLRLEDAQKTANDYKKLEQAIKDFNDYMDRWNPLDSVASNDANFNVNDIVNKYKKKLATILDKEMEAKDKLYASAEAERSRGTYSDEAFESNLRSIVLLAGKEMASNRATFAEMLRKEGEKWVKSWSGLAAFDIKNFSQMTIGELENLQDAISNFTLEEIPADIREVLANSVPGGLESFVDGVKKWLGELDNKAELKQADKFMETANLIGKAMDDAAGSAQSLVDAFASPAFADAFKDISTFTKSAFTNITQLVKVLKTENAARKAWESDATNAGKAFESGFKIEKVTSIIGIITTLLGSWINGWKKKIDLNSWVEATAREMADYKDRISIDNTDDTIFGRDYIRQVYNAIKAVEIYKKRIDSIDLSQITFSDSINLADAWKNQDILPTFDYDDLRQRLDGVRAVIETYEKRGSWNTGISRSEYNTLKEYESALEQLIAQEDELMSLIKEDWSQVADAIVDSMLSAYDELGDATIGLADNIDDAFANVARSILKSMLSSVLIQNVIDKAKGPLMEMYNAISEGDTSSAMQGIAAIRDIFATEVPALGELINVIGDMLKNEFGLDITGGAQSAETLANGIKGITENQADLLASYLNAIRADVAYNRQTMGTMSSDLKVLLGLVPQSMSLELYMQQIIANQQTMIGRIDSVLTSSEMGGVGVKVIMS